MTDKLPVAAPSNIWYDAEPVTSSDLAFEQSFNNNTTASLINNQIGSGSIPQTLLPNIIFDSDLTTGNLDGIGVSPQRQPSDSTYGNQLSISLSNSLAAGNRTVKIAIIGLDFNSDLQYDTFTFHVNETQYTSKHYTQVLTLLFNDVSGPSTVSFNLGGHIIIQEIAPFTISRDPIMVAQNQQPNLFFRDFASNATYDTLQRLLQAALPLYNFDNLNITTGVQQNLAILQGDVTTQIGEKFLATTNNIQKVTLLMSVQNRTTATKLIWQGDIIVSIYPLQSTVNCITDIVPGLAINFTPSNVALAQTSVNYSSLQALGTVLDGNPQPVDFVFSNTQVASGAITPGSYYIVTVKRSGSAAACDILLSAGANLTPNSQVSTFTGTTWVDNPDLNLWFEIWTDAIQVSDGQAYETGHGIVLPKTAIDPDTNTTVDNSLGDVYFTGTNEYTAVLSAQTLQSNPEPDQRTGNPVNTQQQFVPSVQLYNALDLSNLEAASEPLTIGVALDKNVKVISSEPAMLAALHSWTFVGNTIIIKIVDDITDPRYDANVIALVSSLLSGAFTDAKIIPDLSIPTIFYRIASASLCTMLYGDVDGDGVITTNDLALCNSLVGAEMNASPPVNSIITTSSLVLGGTTTVINGYSMLANPFVNDFGISWQVVDPSTNLIKAFASPPDGVLTVNPNNPSLAVFESESASTDFTSLVTFPSGIGSYSLVMTDATNESNQGAFTIDGYVIDPITLLPDIHFLNIEKTLYTSNSIQEMLRADIDGDGYISQNDGYLVESYINKATPFPPTSSPYNKIGTPFNILSLSVEPFIDRTDDFQDGYGYRAVVVHPIQDIFLNDGYFQSNSYGWNDGYGWNFLQYPVSFNIVQQFVWEPYLLAANGSARPVPTVFTNETGLVREDCALGGIANCESYQQPPSFDPGTIDFFVPNNLILGMGSITTPDGYLFKQDFEVCPIVLEIPNSVLGQEQAINIMDYFVVDNGLGITRLGYPCKRYSDCSTVQSGDILAGRIRFGVSLESLSPNVNGISFAIPPIDGYTGIIVDNINGVSLDPTTGILKLNFANLYQDPVLRSLSTKVFITVYLKKAGFNNTAQFIGSTQMENLLTLIPPS